MTAEMARPPGLRRAAVLTVSDRVAAGAAVDESGPLLARRLGEAGWAVVDAAVVPDDVGAIAEALTRWSDQDRLPLVLTTGGTGLAPRDVTPDATRAVAEREIPGIAEGLRAASLRSTPHAMLSRALAVSRGATLVVNLPGSPRGAAESLDVLFPVLDHAVELLSGRVVAPSAHRAPGPSS